MDNYDHFAFQVGNMDAAIRFYVDTLGFALASRATNQEEQEEYSFLTLNNLRLELIQDLKQAHYPRPEVRPPYCPNLAIETQDMDKTVAELGRRGVKLLRGPLEIKGEETWLYFTDPDNNVLEYIQWFHHK
jgi:lactoylglutathione lyase